MHSHSVQLKNSNTAPRKKVLIDLSDLDNPNHDEYICFFPSEEGSFTPITSDEMSTLLPLYSKLYQKVGKNMAQALSTILNIEEKSAEILGRCAVIPLLHFFIDRLIRMNHLIRDYHQQAITIVDLGPTEIPSTPDRFQELAINSITFNQAFLVHLANLWKIPILQQKPIEPSSVIPHPFLNNNLRFYHHRTSFYIKKAFHKLIGEKWSKLFCPIPVLPLATMKLSFIEKRFYLRFFSEVPFTWNLKIDPPNIELRNNFFKPILKTIRPELDLIIKKGNITDSELRKKALDNFNDYFIKYYPSALFESLSDNLSYSLSLLKRFKNKTLLFSDDGKSTKSAYLIAAARILNMKIIGIQHGGNYGYLKDYVDADEYEYINADQYVTWGWTRLPETSSSHPINLIPLPSPWLSNRKKYWENHFKKKKNAPKKFDFLLMSNSIKRYPPSPCSGVIFSMEHITPVSTYLKDFVYEAASRKYKILHKPFNFLALNLLNKTFSDMAIRGGISYQTIIPAGKGLTPNLVEQCKMILWDQPGTGFLECLVCNLPTMVLWPRTYSQEVVWAQKIFHDLEKVGIVHREIKTLLNEYEKFNQSPQAWMENTCRREVIIQFCNEYAWADKNWSQYWRQFLKTL